jgi:hypothetical protein
MLLTILGIVLVVYGVFKIIYGLYDNLMTRAQRIANKQKKWLKFITSADYTFASKMVSLSLLFFGIYTLIHGLDILGVFNANTHEILETYFLGKIPLFIQFSIYSVVITVFYVLVVYTDFPIQKDPNNMFFYIVGGLCLGLSFIISLPIMVLYYLGIEHGFDKLFELFPWLTILNILACIAYIILMMYLTLDALKDKLNKDKKQIRDMTFVEIYTLVSTLIMIPLNIIA